MPNFKEGERVQIVTRTQTSNDIKERVYYPYMGGLRGAIYRLYSDGRAAVQVDLDSLPETVLTRHTEAQERMKNRWIESLSEEARSRLTPEEREFHLNYVLLVRVEDLQPEGKRARATATAKKANSEPEPAAVRATDTGAVQSKARATAAPPTNTQATSRQGAQAANLEPETPKRKTLKDLEKAEEEFLKSRQRRTGR
ncbi:MAG: hypothetical protein RMM08_02800 [Armatimonadota bacterium]|nr:hypothetical protein [bacterium]MDW8320268.1 hypothetical protein [Armatimonadota bacterium]